MKVKSTVLQFDVTNIENFLSLKNVKNFNFKPNVLFLVCRTTMVDASVPNLLKKRKRKKNANRSVVVQVTNVLVYLVNLLR